jgi:acyl-CoA thioester hydrolase
MARHTYLCPMRWSDMDAYGHVNNVDVMRYLEQARIDVLEATAGPDGQSMLHEGVVVVRHEVDYRKPLDYRPEPVPIHTWIAEVRRSSFTVAYEIADPDAVYVQARTVLVPFDLESGSPRRISERDRAWMDRYLEA